MNIGKVKINWLLFLICSVVYFIGYCAGKQISWTYFVISKELKIADLVTILVTISVGMYIANVIEKKNQVNRAEKDLLIKKLERTIDHIENYNREIGKLSYDFASAISGIENIKRSINCVFASMDLVHYLDISKPSKAELLKCIKTINRLSTDTPIHSISSQNPDISILNNVVTIRDNRMRLIASEVEILINNLFRLQFNINSH